MVQPERRTARTSEGPGTLGFRPVQALGLTQEATRQLYEAIVEGRLQLGQRLSEAALSREMGISRGPIREAQRRLEQQGLLTFSPRRGFFVRELTPEQVDDVFGVRIVLETHAVRLAAACADDAGLARLAAWRDEMIALDRRRNLTPSEFVEQDLALHRLIVELSGSETLPPLFDSVINQVRLGLSLINLRFGKGERLARGHDDIVDSLLARDAGRAAKAMEAHLTRSRDLMRERLAERLAVDSAD